MGLQDNEISWLNWDCLDSRQDLFTYVQTLIALRAAHPVLRAPHFDSEKNGTGYPELSFHSTVPWEFDRNAPALTFAVLYAEDHVKYKTQADAFLYVLVNAHWEEQTFTLPALPDGLQWYLTCASRGICCPAGEESPLVVPAQFTLGPRETAVLIGK